MRRAIEQYPYIEEAIVKLKYAGIAKMNYRQDKVKEKLNRMNKKENPDSIFNASVAKLLSSNKELYSGAIIPASKAKEILSEAYSKSKITAKATAVHMREYYNITEPKATKIGNSTVHAFSIISPKFNLN
jgi:hypothetical protein